MITGSVAAPSLGVFKVGWSSEQSGIGEDVPEHSRGSEQDDL